MPGVSLLETIGESRQEARQHTSQTVKLSCAGEVRDPVTFRNGLTIRVTCRSLAGYFVDLLSLGGTPE